MKRVLAWVAAVITFCWIAALAAPAVAQDYRVINYQNAVSGLVSRWAADEITLEGQLFPVLKEVEETQAIPNPTDADKARIDELIKRRDDLSAQMDAASDNLRLELLLVEVEPGAPERELIQLPDWLTGIIKAKGVPVGHGITLVPDASFDVKALKLKSFSVGLRFSWG
jgi:hypothetical protein